MLPIRPVHTIEIPFVEAPENFKDGVFVPFHLFVKAVGQQSLGGIWPDTEENVTFVTRDENRNVKILTLPKPSGIGSHSPFTIEPGEQTQFDVRMPYDLLNDIHGTIAIRFPLNVDGSKIEIESAPIDARLINDFINSVSAVAPKLTPIPEANLNPLPAGTTTTFTSPGSSPGPSAVTVAKPDDLTGC